MYDRSEMPFAFVVDDSCYKKVKSRAVQLFRFILVLCVSTVVKGH